MTTTEFSTTQTTAGTTSSDHSIPIIVNGTTMYVRLSSTPKQHYIRRRCVSERGRQMRLWRTLRKQFLAKSYVLINYAMLIRLYGSDSFEMKSAILQAPEV